MADRSPGSARAAATLLSIEALGLAALAIWQVVELITAETTSIASAIALVVMTLMAAAAVGAFSYGVAAGRQWGRSGGIVTQVLVFAVAVGSVTGAYPHWGIALALALPAVIGFVLILRAAKDAAPPRDAR